MAWSNSKAFARYVERFLSRGAAYDLDTDTYKVALYNNTGTPDNTVATGVLTAYNGAASQWVVANEVTGTGWSAGGVSLSGVTVAQSSANITFDATDTSASTVTVSGTFGCLVYNTNVTTDATNAGVSYHYFGGSQSCTAATFTIVWAATGLVQFQC